MDPTQYNRDVHEPRARVYLVDCVLCFVDEEFSARGKARLAHACYQPAALLHHKSMSSVDADAPDSMIGAAR